MEVSGIFISSRRDKKNPSIFNVENVVLTIIIIINGRQIFLSISRYFT